MSKTLTYSGISTKIKAMKKKLITPQEYQQLESLSSVSEALAYLKKKPAYEILFRDYDEARTHRGDIEAVLTNSLYHDFSKLYRFANLKQRKFMDFYFIHYEANLLKNCVRCAYTGIPSQLQLPMFKDFFEKHSALDVVRLSGCLTIGDFINALSGTKFYNPLSILQQSEHNSLFDYESALDQFYFSTVWKEKDKILKGKELNTITATTGYRIDLLNMRWIHRAKKYYRMSSADMYSMLIPCRYKLTAKQVSAMVECGTVDELISIMRSTYYGKHYGEEISDIHSTERLYTEVIENIYALTTRENPYSIAPVNSYLYFKEHEIRRITTIIEGIRYNLSPREISEYVVNAVNK